MIYDFSYQGIVVLEPGYCWDPGRSPEIAPKKLNGDCAEAGNPDGEEYEGSEKLSYIHYICLAARGPVWPGFGRTALTENVASGRKYLWCRSDKG